MNNERQDHGLGGNRPWRTTAHNTLKGDDRFHPFRMLLAVACLAGLAVGQSISFGLMSETIPFNARIDAAVDVDADGDLDLVACTSIGTYAVYLNDGRAEFTALIGSSSGTYTALDTATADFNGDGLPDLLAGISSGFQLRFGLGGGQFGPPQPTPFVSGPEIEIESGDVDLDGDQDVMVFVPVAWFGAQSQSRLWLNTGAGVFVDATAGSGLSAGNVRGRLVDMDGDGLLDAVGQSLLTQFPGSVVMQRGLGGGQFGPLIPIASFGTAIDPARHCVLDVDRDGRLDVVIEGPNVGQIQWSRQSPSLVFTPQTPWTVGFDVNALEPVDLDADGHTEIVVLGANDTFALATGSATTGVPTLLRAEGGRRLMTGDLDGDGDRDLLLADARGLRRILFNDGQGGVAAPFGVMPSGATIFSIPNGNGSFAYPADHDGDGDLDLCGPSSSSSMFAVSLGDGEGRFASAVALPIANPPTPLYSYSILRVFDLDGDGDADYLIRDSDPSGFWFGVLRNDGPAGMQRVLFTALTGYPLDGTRAQDFDGDGDIDLALTFSVGASTIVTELRILANDGAGAFTVSAAYVIPSGSGTIELAPGDLNDDGIPDLVVRNEPNDALVMIQTAPLVFTASMTLPSAYLTAGADIVDVDGDGWNDVMLGLRWFRRIGASTFDLPEDIPYAGPFSVGTSAADLDGDGDPDLIDRSNRFYWVNDGAGAFTAYPAPSGLNDAPRYADVDRDGDLDVVLKQWVVLENRSVQLRMTSPLRPDAVAALALYGASGQTWWLAVDVASAAISLPTPFGRLALDPSTAVLLAGGAFDATGRSVFEAYLDANLGGALLGQTFVFQAIVSTPSGPRLTGALTLPVDDF